MRNFTLGVAVGVVLAFTGSTVGKQQSPCSDYAAACGKHVAESLQGRGWLGLELHFDPNAAGQFEVLSVFDHGPAATTAVEPGDRLIGIGDVRFEDLDARSAGPALREQLGSMTPGQKTTLHLVRGTQPLAIDMVMGSYSERAYAEILGRHLLAEAPELVVGVLEPKSRAKARTP